MATPSRTTIRSDEIDQVLYVRNAQGFYHGFKKVYLAQELSVMENDFLTCSKCLGFAREAISSGETRCELCKEENSVSNPARRVRNWVGDLSIRCPLMRDCEWTGKLDKGEEHLKECGTFLLTCPLKCGEVMRRSQKNRHLQTICPLRKVRCQYCGIIVISRNLTNHLSTCPAYPVVCKCDKELLRDRLEEHIDRECGWTEIDCPYAKYGCRIGKIQRKDLLAHKREFYIEHQDLLEGESSQKLETLEGKYDRLKSNYSKLQQESRIQKKLLGTTIVFNPKSQSNQSNEFSNGQYTFICETWFGSSGTMNVSLKRLRTQTNSDKNILCITNCVVLLHETATQKESHIVDQALKERMDTRDQIDFAIKLGKKTVLKYRQDDGNVIMEVFFDYDYTTYRYF